MHPILTAATQVERAEAGVKTSLPCFLVRGVFTREECARLIQAAEAGGFQATGGHYPPSYRDNDRLVRDDAALAEAVFARIRRFLPERRVDEAGVAWRLRGLNPRFRFCRYRGGQRFCIHRDGAYAPSPEERTHLTCMLYLNDSGEFTGGTTRYYAERSGEAGLLGEVRPEAGTLIVFDHELWHDGEAVTSGTKYVMRTDVLYAREEPASRHARATPREASARLLAYPVQGAPREIVLTTREAPANGAQPDILAGHQGYVWSVLARRDGSLATASRDGTVRLWRPSGDTWRAEAVLTGHTASVVALAEDARGQLWSASRDHTVRRWEGAASQIIGRHEGAALCLAALPDGRMASGGADGLIHLWSSEGAALHTLRGHTGWVWALALLDSGLLASASEDGTVRVWHLERASEATPPALLGGPVRALAALPSGRLLTGQASGELTEWRLSLTPHPTLQARGTRRVHTGAVCAIAALSEDRVASGGEDDGIHLTRLPEFTGLGGYQHEGFVRGLAALSGERLASASYDTTVRLWSLAQARAPSQSSTS